MKDKTYNKAREYCHYTGEYRGTARNMWNWKYSERQKVTIFFRNGSNYDCYFIIKELTEEFKKKFNWLGEITEKYITFTVPIKKEVTKIDKIGEQITKHISYILQLIDSTRCIASSLSLVKNLSEGIHRIKCKYRHDDKNVRLVKLNIIIVTVFIKTQISKII